VACLASPAYAIDFWHSSTVWAGQGQCSATFSFDSGLEPIEALEILVTVIDKSGKKVESGELAIQEFGQSSADRYADAHMESAAICADDLTIVVNKATALIDGKQTDLLKSKKLSTRDFKPFKIRIGK